MWTGLALDDTKTFADGVPSLDGEGLKRFFLRRPALRRGPRACPAPPTAPGASRPPTAPRPRARSGTAPCRRSALRSQAVAVDDAIGGKRRQPLARVKDSDHRMNDCPFRIFSRRYTAEGHSPRCVPCLAFREDFSIASPAARASLSWIRADDWCTLGSHKGGAARSASEARPRGSGRAELRGHGRQEDS